MGFFSLFKKKEKQEERVDYFRDLGQAIQGKKLNVQNKEKIILETIKNRISQLNDELNSQISVLELIDLHNVKAEQRLKFIVLENLANYIKYLEKLREDLKNINSDDSLALIESINRVFADFESRSRTSREKVTYLIGKEIRDVKDSIGKFFRDLDHFGKEESQFFDQLNLIKQSENFFKKIKEVESSKNEVEKEKNVLESEIKSLQKDLEKVISDMEKMKGSEEYEVQRNKKEQIKSLQEKLNKELLELKAIVDIKTLSKKYHHEEKKMKTIKEYDENFSKILSDESIVFLNLLDEKTREKAVEKIYALKEQIEEVTLLVNNKNRVEELEDERNDVSERISGLSEEIEKKQKGYEKFCEEIETLKHFIKANLDRIE